MDSPAQQKRQAFANHIRSEQRKRIFQEQRKRFDEAQRREDRDEMAEALKEINELFHDRTEEIMALADKYDEEQQQYEAYMEQMEEESITFEMNQRKEEIEAIKKQLSKMIEEEEWSQIEPPSNAGVEKTEVISSSTQQKVNSQQSQEKNQASETVSKPEEKPQAGSTQMN